MSDTNIEKIMEDLRLVKPDNDHNHYGYISKNYVKYANISSIKFLFECGLKFSYESILTAINRNDIEIIKYINSKYQFDQFDCDEFIRVSIKNKNLELIKFFVEDIDVEEFDVKELEYAILIGDIDIIKYIYKKCYGTNKSEEYMKSIGI
jgi:hypothetical protein